MPRSRRTGAKPNPEEKTPRASVPGRRKVPQRPAISDPLRIAYVHPLLLGDLGGWGGTLDRIATLGFNVVLTAPLFVAGPSGNLFFSADLDSLHPAIGGGNAVTGIAGLVDECRGRRLALMSDLVVDRIAAEGPLAERFRLAQADPDLPDPRRPPLERHTVRIPEAWLADPSHPYLAMWTSHLRRLADAGLAGLRCVRPTAMPSATWATLIGDIRKTSAQTRFLVWSPDLPAAEIERLIQAGFDGAFSSLPWWDGKAAWLADEHDRLRRFGAVIAPSDAPFHRRAASTPDPTLGRHRKAALALAAALGDGLMVTVEPDAADPRSARRHRSGQTDATGDLDDAMTMANRLVAEARAPARVQLLSQPTAPATALLRRESAIEGREAARLVLLNPGPHPTTAKLSSVLRAPAAEFLPFRDTRGTNLGPGDSIVLAPYEVAIADGAPSQPILTGRTTASAAVKAAAAKPRLAIERISPAVDDGRFPVKRMVGDEVHVEADVFGDGHDPIAAVLLWRAADQTDWHEVRMAALGNDRWAASFPLLRLGRHFFTIEAWRDDFAAYRYGLEKKSIAGLNVALELKEGRLLVDKAIKTAGNSAPLRSIGRALAKETDEERLARLLSPETAATMAAADPKHFRLRRDPPLAVDAERSGAGFASWYELFPRSQSKDPARHGTFDDVIARLPAIREMGFDVLYFPPIHPIGKTNRKGRCNSLTATEDDPGSPYAIGAAEGGHTALHPELGSFEDFRRLLTAARDHGLEVALDFAIQCSPDHPWLAEHPDWFQWRPDGSIRHAENPPKTYEDIVNVDFYADGAVPGLWIALRDVVLFWVKQGVRLLRVDNPHTKPFPFWEWMIGEVRAAHPDVVFLAEAFTRPKVMYRLAKLGFSQSYTYFTWRNTKTELESYLIELTTTEPKDFFRPHFFVNTPDINPPFLQNAPRAAYLIRAALATTLSGLWGMYNGFEICEGRPDATLKEYADSEKYELKAWDWDRPGNIIAEISLLNRIRRDNPALHSHLGISFHLARNDQVLYFEKATPERDNVLLVAVNLDPHAAQEAEIEVPLWKWRLPDHAAVSVEDLMRGNRFTWHGKVQRVRLDPHELPFSIWRVAPL